MRREHVGVVGVDDGRLDAPAEDRLGVVHDERVERVVGGDEDGERASAGPAGASRLLPERRQGSRPSGEQDGVEAAHVDPQLERVGRREPQQLLGSQRALELATLLGQEAAAVGGHAPLVGDGDPLLRDARHDLDTRA